MPMFERLQKPFLTVETGEAYGPIRLEYDILDSQKLIATLNQLQCCEKSLSGNAWQWFWRDEADDLHFESLDKFQRNPNRPIRLATLSIREQKLFINWPSFKRACLAVPFWNNALTNQTAKIHSADFINKIFGLDERLTHGFTELFNDEELENIVHQRVEHYEKIQTQIENAATAEEAFTILAEYTKSETNKRLPFAERYDFTQSENVDPDVLYLSFYIFLRSRELVALRRWHGETGATLAEVAEDTIKDVFGDMDIDIID